MSTLLATPDVKDAGMNLARETVCVTVSFGLLGNSRKVSNSAIEVDADKALIRVHKTLLDSPELDAIRKADGEMRRRLYDLCLPFDVGIYLLPNKLIAQVVSDLRQFKAKRAILVERFITAYESLRNDARIRLRSLYNPRDYPAPEVVRSKFYCDWEFVSFGTPDSLESISRELFEEEKQKAANKFQNAAEEITAVMRQTLAELVTHLREKLEPAPDGKQKIIRETAVTNLTEFLKTFDLRNVTNDTELADLATKCRSLLSGRSADMFRESENLRRSVSADLAGIKTELDKLVQDKPSRKFRFEED
jgi:Protein of unknown function (DUF3150)